MRVMVLIKATKDSEEGKMPGTKLFTDMAAFNEALAKAGMLLMGDGLHPSSRAKRVRFSGNSRQVIDGPFDNAVGTLLSGFWIWQVKSMEEAVEWVKRCPESMGDAFEIEIRPIFESEDFGEEYTPELRDREERLRAEVLEGRI